MSRTRFGRTPRAITIIATLTASAQPAGSSIAWPTLAGDPAHAGTRFSTTPSLATPRWTRATSTSGQPIQFVGPAGLAACTLPLPRIFATAQIAGQTHAIALDAETGQVAWATPLPNLVFSSWSSPAIDESNALALFACGDSLTALRIADGSLAWRTQLGASVVNASPVVLTDSLRERAFITTDGGFGGPSSLLCINVAPRRTGLNDIDPGEIVWSVPIGSASGATPALLDGTIFVASTGLDQTGFGEIRAFNARATSPPAPEWTFTNPLPISFFGGLAVRQRADEIGIYAATYAFSGGLDSANLIKLDARTGALRWSIACNRTASIPLILNDRIVLSTGIQGFGSLPLVQMFEDHGSSASQLWNSALGTWNDLNSNAVIDAGEYLRLGGWNTQPILANPRSFGATPRLLVGAIATSPDPMAAYTDLYELDLARFPGDPAFVAQHTTAAGSSPALLGSALYSVGPLGLAAFGPPPPRADLTADTRITIDDLYAWELNTAPRDIDRSGAADAADRAFLLSELRRNEHRALEHGR